MKKRIVIAAATIMMMLMTMVPASAFAATKAPQGEEMVESFELVYAESIKDRSKYCDDVWEEIQTVYMQGRDFYKDIDIMDLLTGSYDEDELLASLEAQGGVEPAAILPLLGQLTWVKKHDNLDKAGKVKLVKDKYLAEIKESAKLYKKADYNSYNWDLIQDSLYIGKKMINESTTFAEAAAGYYCVTLGLESATDKETLKWIKDDALYVLTQYVYLWLDKNDYTESTWAAIEAKYKEGKKAINKAELELELEEIVEDYGQQLADLSGDVWPVDYEDYEALALELMVPAVEVYEEIDWTLYSLENQEYADELIMCLEWDLSEVETRAEADKMVNEAIEEMQAMMTKEEEIALLNSYVPVVKTVGKNGTSITVSWNADKRFDGYELYRATSKNGKYTLVQSFWSGSRKSYTDTKKTFGKTYYYKVRAYKSIDWTNKYSAYSKPVAGTTKLMPPASLSLSKVNKEDVKLTWKAVTGASGYEIYRAKSENSAFKKVKTITKGKTVNWTDTSTVKGKSYSYKIRSYVKKADGTKKYSGYTTIKTIKR